MLQTITLILLLTMRVGLPSAFANGIFAMHPEQAQFYLPMVINILEGREVQSSSVDNHAEIAYPLAKDPITGSEFSCMAYDVRTNSYSYRGFDDAPKNSVAVLPIRDAIMKYDYCGSMGTKTLAQVIADASASDNIAGILLEMDTPGGELFGTKDLSDAIAATDKPVVAYIGDSICASAGYYVAAPSDKILMGQPTSMVGSIGVYTTIIDPKGAAEKLGYKIHTIYSPNSPDKNKEYREAFDDENPSSAAMKERLSFMDDVFMNQVKTHRPNISDKALAGGMFFMQDAIDNGLADGTASFQEAIEEVINLSTTHQIIK